MNWIFLFKSLHILGFVSWFAGLFYLVRLFVYHTEAFEKLDPDRQILTQQYHIMEWRLYKIITNPAMIITWFFGLAMIYVYGWEWFKYNTWLQFKIGLVVLLTFYHLRCKKIILLLKNGEKPMSSGGFRLFNEVPTMFLLSIVLLAVYKNTLNFIYAFVGLLVFGMLLFGGIKWYKKVREKN